jgi:hypothetical protein
MRRGASEGVRLRHAVANRLHDLMPEGRGYSPTLADGSFASWYGSC